MKRDIRIETVYPYPPERIWLALTNSDVLSQWLMPNDFEPRVGHQFRFRTKPAPGFDGIVHCEVLELIEPELLSFTWKGGPVDTIVTFTLDRIAEGTRLCLEQRGFKGFSAVSVSYLLGQGWKKMFGRILPKVLNQLPHASVRMAHKGATPS